MNEKALHQFMINTEQARELLATIQAELDDHMNLSPEAVHWGHVGDSKHVLESLRDIARFMGHED